MRRDRAGRVIRSILVLIAPGRQCSHFSRAVWLARRNGAEIILLRVMPHSEQSAERDLESGPLIAMMDAPSQPRNVVEMQRDLIEIAEREIDGLQTQCSTSATTIVATGNGVQSLSNRLKEFSSTLVVIDRVSHRWGDNDRIYEIIRYCKTSVLIRVKLTMIMCRFRAHEKEV